MHNVIIVGGGAGGLELVTKLSTQKNISVTLIDMKLTHLWKPLLHEVVSGRLDISENEVNYLIHSYEHNYNYIYGSLIDINKKNKSIDIEITSLTDPTLKITETISYDTLVLALGSKSNDFNVKGVQEHCYFLDSQNEAKKIHDKIFMSYLDMKQKVLPAISIYDVAIIGAGATGVELISELINLRNTISQTLFTESSQISINFTLIDSAERILSGLSTTISEEVEDKLTQMGISVLKKRQVTAVDNEYIHFNDGSMLKADLKIWTAGIKAPKVLEKLENFEKDKIHRLKVYATLQTYTDPNIFAIGDCANCQLDASKPPLGARAQVASQQAEFLASSLMSHIENTKLPMFKFVEKGSIISLGPKQAVGEVFNELSIHGKLARATYEALYKIHQVNIHGVQQTIQLHKKANLTKNLLKKMKLY